MYANIQRDYKAKLTSHNTAYFGVLFVVFNTLLVVKSCFDLVEQLFSGEDTSIWWFDNHVCYSLTPHIWQLNMQNWHCNDHSGEFGPKDSSLFPTECVYLLHISPHYPFSGS